ncbi:hypothetical protein FA13DRAFT_829684 [Coprinellus micaceus]|uniref:F-box domain-containing protein n=1 Tax=Coprinellus micaceus TaxID=71717 RepID=A0A4Y7T1Q6_COPMI|nr:hypothetical protein FA13DRAFT_829684 [Coprinellus micaceus]
MFQLPRRKDRVLDTLLDCNTPPTDYERAEIDQAIEALKIKYQRASGMEYLPNRPIRQAGRKYHDKILRYQLIVSPIRTVPPEIWYRVFENTVLTIEPKTQQSVVLRDLRLVSKAWNAVAIDWPILWCSLPMIDHTVIPITSENSPNQPPSTWTLYRYLTRARRPKPLPISFTFHSWSESGAASEAKARAKQALAWVRMLAAEIDLWGEVKFQGTRSFQETLMGLLERYSRNGNFPLLSKFSFERRGIDTANTTRYTTWRETLDLSMAPLLKHVVFDSLNPFQGPEHLSFHGTITRLTLPWAQLETFRCATQRDMIYHYTLEEAVNIQALGYTSNQMDTLPSTATSLLRLTKLSLCFGDAMPGVLIENHLGQSLTLPVLKELEVFWGKIPRERG